MQPRMLVVPALAAGFLLAGPAQAQDTNALVLKMAQEIDALKAEIEPLKALLQGAVVAFDRSQATGSCPRGWKPFEPAGGRFIVGAGTNTNKDMNGGTLTDHPAYSDDSAEAVGGEEAHKLAAAELAAHKHSGKTETGMPTTIYRVMNSVGFKAPKDNMAGFDRDGVGDFRQVDPTQNPELPGPQHVHKFETDEGMGLAGQPHNNMPPFVALYYCIKE